MGMQQMVGQMSVGFAQPFPVQLHQIRVLVGLAQDLALILAVEGLGPLLAVVLLRASGLAAASQNLL